MYSVTVGQLNRRITIVKMEDYKTKIGATRKGEVDYISLWAKVEPLRGKSYYDNFREGFNNPVRITIRFRHDIDEGMLVRLVTKGIVKHYKIDSIINPKVGNNTLELMCSEKVMGKRE